MTKPTLLALAATLAIAAGSLAAIPGTASAQPYGGPGYHGGWNDAPRGPGLSHGPRQICKPVLRTVKVHGNRGWHWQKVVVGKRCFSPGRPNW